MALYDYTQGRYVTMDSFLHGTPTRTAVSEESFGATVFASLIVAGVSKAVTLVFESKGAIFAPNLFICSMVIGELAAELIVKIATGFKPQTPDLMLQITAAQLIIALPITLLTNCALAMAFGAPFALGTVIFATVASFIALRVAIVAVAVLLITLVGVAAVITS